MSPRREERAARGGRPRGEARQALADAAKWWQAQRIVCPLAAPDGELLVGCTGLEMMHRARVGRHVSAQTLKDMVRSGDLVKVGKVQVEGIHRLLTVYAPGENTAGNAWALRHGELADAVGAMARVE